MFECKFVYQSKGGGSSNSLNQSYKIHAVPRAGDSVTIIDKGDRASDFEVKKVVHYIDPSNGTHEITVFYGDK